MTLLAGLVTLFGALGGGGDGQAAEPRSEDPGFIRLDVPVGERPDLLPMESAPGTSAPGAAPPVRTASVPPAEVPVSSDSGLLRKFRARIREAQEEAARRGKIKAREVLVGVHVVDLRTREPLVRLEDEELLAPASNQKLLTVAAALLTLGEEASFETPFELSAQPVDGVVDGALIVRAGADPIYSPGGDGSIEAWAAPLIESLRSAGVKEVKGGLLLDPRGLPEPGPPSGWPSEEEHWKEYCALSGPFTVNAGCMQATLRPVRGQKTVPILLRPRGHGLKERLGVTTKDGPLDVRVGVAGSQLTVKGTLPASREDYVSRFSHPDPTALFAGALLAELDRAGVGVEGWRLAPEAPEGMPLVTLRSPILGAITPILRDSNNSVADQLALATRLRPLGAAGGAVSSFGDVVQDALAALGVDGEGQVSVDGSGLSRDNRVTPLQLASLLSALTSMPGALEATLDALPRSGETGTLDDRMTSDTMRGRVLAKTGFINGVSGLSGYVLGQDGVPALAFSFLVRYRYAAGLNSRVFKPMQDDLCGLLVERLSR